MERMIKWWALVGMVVLAVFSLAGVVAWLIIGDLRQRRKSGEKLRRRNIAAYAALGAIPVAVAVFLSYLLSWASQG